MADNEQMNICAQVQRHADEIRKILEQNDCSDVIALHISRNMEVVRFDTNNETYVNFKDGWHKL